jgi:hypothetical protein
MDSEHHSFADLAEGSTPFVAGLGLITVILFPFAVPILLFLALLALPVVLAGLVAALIGGAIGIVRHRH